MGLVLVIWGIIGYKIINAFSADPVINTVTRNVSFKPKKVAKKDTFSLLANYRDPFLGTWNKAKKKKAKGIIKRKSVQFPNIVFTGLVSGAQTKDHIFFVTIAGKQYLMNKGAANDGVTLVSGTSRNIKVRYKGTLKTITLTNGAP